MVAMFSLTTRNGQIALITAIALISGLFFWYLFSGVPIKNLPPKGDTIIAFGDSLTLGVGALPLHDYPSLLSERLGKPIINAGVSGDTTTSALNRLEKDVLSKHPHVVIVLLGGNDFLQGTERAETFKNLETIITRIQKTGAVVLLVGIRGGFPSDPYASEFERLHRDFGTAFVPNIMRGVIGESSLMSEDRVHPNDAGYRVFADALYPVLAGLYY